VFTTDSRTENFLTQMGVQYSYRNGLRFPEEFAPGWDQENLGRPVAVREDAVLEYAALMEGGSAAPATILCATRDGFRVLDGVQRLSAELLQETTRISAYVVETDSEDSLAAIRVLANARMQGRAEPAEWTRRQAVEVLIIARKMSYAEVAKMGGWKTADVKRIAEAIELQSWIRDVGGPADLPDLLLAELRPHLETGNLLEKATLPITAFLQTIRKAKLSVQDAVPFIDEFFAPLPKGSNPYQVYSSRLDDVHKETEISTRLTGRQRMEIPKDVVLLRALKTVETVVDSILTHGEPVPNVDEFFHILNRVTKKLKVFSTNKKNQKGQPAVDRTSR